MRIKLGQIGAFMFILAVICLLFWWINISFSLSIIFCVLGFLMIISDKFVKGDNISIGDEEASTFLVIGTAIGFYGIVLFFRGMSEPFYDGDYGVITGWNIGLYFRIWYLNFAPVIAGLCATFFVFFLFVREYYVCRLLYLGGFLIALISQGALIHGFYIASLSNDISFGKAIGMIGLSYGWVLCVIGGVLVSIGAELIIQYGLLEPSKPRITASSQKTDKFCPCCGETNPNDYNFCRGWIRRELVV